jgi:hypothetical protein
MHLFIHILLTANHKNQKWKGIDIERGQILTGRTALSTQTGISQMSIRTCLKRLEQSEVITIKSTNRYTLISVVNYDSYQDKQPATNQQLTSDQPATNQQLTTNKNVKKVKNEKKEPVKRFVPPSLDQVTAYCQERQNKIDPQRFIDHYESNGWKVGRNKMKSWQAAVRTWEKNDSDKKQPQKTFEQMKVDNTKDGMVEFVKGRQNGVSGRGRVCNNDGKAIPGISD